MKPSGSLDTNLLLRLITLDVPQQHRAVKKLLETEQKFLVDDIAVVEIVYALQGHYKFSRAQIANSILPLLQIAQIIVDDSLIKTSVEYYLAHPALSFEDCYLSAKAGKINATPLWTFDRKLASQLPEAKLLAVE